MVSPATATNGNKGSAKAPEASDEEFSDHALSRPIFAASRCKGPIEGVVFNVLGPFPAGKDSVNQDPWYAYEVRLLKACDLVGTDKEVTNFPAGTVCMVPVGAELRALAPHVVQEDRVWAFRLTPGPQPKPGKMRSWKAQIGKPRPRGESFPLLKAPPVNVFALPAASGGPDDGYNGEDSI